MGKPFEIPILFFLIQHNDKNILFDTGYALEVSKSPEKHLGAIVNSYCPIVKEKQYIVNQLKNMRINPEDIDYVIFSHLHPDHAGSVGIFPNAVHIIHKKELEWDLIPNALKKVLIL